MADASADYRALEALGEKRKSRGRGQRAAEKAQKEKPSCSTCLKKAATNEERKGSDRDKLGDKQEAFLTKKEDEDEATGLIEENEEKRGSCATKKF